MGRGSGVFGEGRPDEQPAGDGPEGSSNETSEDSGSGANGADGPVDSGGQSTKAVAIALAAAALIAGGASYALSQEGGSSPARSQPAVVRETGPMLVKSVLPVAGARNIDGAAPITVNFSYPVAGNSPRPVVSPRVAGSWNASGTVLTFTPDVPFQPATSISVRVPAGPGGVRSVSGKLLTKSVTEHFTTGTYSPLRLTELLGQLGYLPMSWAPDESGATRAAVIGDSAATTTQAGLAYDPPAGTFYWQAGYPVNLRSQWSPAEPNVITRGAVMAFESQHGLTINGVVNARLWKKLFQAVARNEHNASGYTYAIARKGSPETLTIWHDGHMVLRSLANTGIPAAPTVNGTFPVFARYVHTVMSGTNPDGSHYSDPVSFVSYFNGGDAVHYFARGSYGSPQSLGCVELPYNDAQRAYPYLTYGSLVTVTG